MNQFQLYQHRYPQEKKTVERFQAFIAENPHCFERTLVHGHITGAGLIVTPNFQRVLLTLHKKLGLWLQLGGHCDGDSNVARVARKECEEESGLTELTLVSADASTEMFFDLDIHEIPARKDEPKHLHFDIRYLFIAHKPEKIRISEESTDLRWFDFAEAFRITNEPSMHRQFEKALLLAHRYGK